MPKFLSLTIAIIAMICCAESVSAQQRTKVADGVYLTTYGNVTVIENDNTQQSIQIKVVESDSMYDILCGDTVVKTVAKAGLTEGIALVIQGYTTIPKWVSRAVVRYIVDKIYDGVCEYSR